MPLLSPDRAHLDTTTTPAADSLSPRRRSGERVRERGFKRARQFDGTSPSPPAISPLVPRREREQETSAMVGVSRDAPELGCVSHKNKAISGVRLVWFSNAASIPWRSPIAPVIEVDFGPIFATVFYMP